MKKALLGLVLLSGVGYGQDHANKFFLFWGYNRSGYTTSDLHFQSDHYDFTLKNVKASDRPTRFNRRIYLNPKLFTIPQYNYRFGYNISEKYSISIGMDHLKYVLRVPSNAIINGRIDELASSKYGGVYDNQNIILLPDFLLYEHSDGLNYLSIEADRNVPVLTFGNRKFSLYGIWGVGLGTYIPKTKVSLFGYTLDNKFHLAGWGGSVNLEARLYFQNSLFITLGGKSGWSFLGDVLVDGTDARVNQNFGWYQYYAAVGGQFYLGNGKRKNKIDQTDQPN